MRMTLSHLEASLIFAFFTSIVFGVITRRSDGDRLRYGAICFGYFLLSLLGIGWLMYFGHR
jgi:hypothetical protein